MHSSLFCAFVKCRKKMWSFNIVQYREGNSDSGKGLCVIFSLLLLVILLRMVKHRLSADVLKMLVQSLTVSPSTPSFIAEITVFSTADQFTSVQLTSVRLRLFLLRKAALPSKWPNDASLGI